MNVIVKIDGREAIPVRAVPFLTNWETMTPDAIAVALAHKDDLHWDYFLPLTALRVEDSQLKPIAASWWENFPAKHLSAISTALKARETAGELSHEQAYIEWRSQSLLELPSGVFVWKDDFVQCHSRKYNSYAMTTIRNGKELSKEEQAKRYSLDFDPYIANLETCAAVMQGFERFQSSIINDGTGQHSDMGAVNESPEESSTKQKIKLDEKSAGGIEQKPAKPPAEAAPPAKQHMTGYECDKAQYWQKSDAWTLNEAQALLNGQWPVRGQAAPTSLNASLLATQTSITHTVIEDGIEHHLIEQRTENALFNPVPEGTSITELIENAIAAGILTPLPIRTRSKNKEDPGILLRPSEVIAWANARGCFPDFPFGNAVPAGAAEQEQPEEQESEKDEVAIGTQPYHPQWEMMASSDQLCAAFGSFTGMDSTWFRNLNDAPRLKAARHMPGQGGRVQRKPLFYVYPVFEWLLDTKRRKGRSMRPATGWRILKSHFPMVYARHELLDPNQD